MPNKMFRLEVVLINTFKENKVKASLNSLKIADYSTFSGESNRLDLVGSLFVGSVDYMDPYLKLPPEVWSASLRSGFVGCLKDLFINGAPIDIVTYAHQQDVGKLITELD